MKLWGAEGLIIYLNIYFFYKIFKLCGLSEKSAVYIYWNPSPVLSPQRRPATHRLPLPPSSRDLCTDLAAAGKLVGRQVFRPPASPASIPPTSIVIQFLRSGRSVSLSQHQVSSVQRLRCCPFSLLRGVRIFNCVAAELGDKLLFKNIDLIE